MGKSANKRGKIPNRYTYYGQQLDQITQQYYLRARFYNPVFGRFTQEDTYRGDGLNLYAYCANNPVRYIDPTGFDKEAHKDKGSKGDVKWNNGWRTEDGKFASPKGKQKAGDWAEQDVWRTIESKKGWSVLKGRIYTKNDTGQIRVYDGVAITPKGRYIGLEVKSGGASKTRAQKEFDNRVGKETPAYGVGKSQGIIITHTITIRRDHFESSSEGNHV